MPSNMNPNLAALVAVSTFFLVLVASCTDADYGTSPFACGQSGKCPTNYTCCTGWCSKTSTCPDAGPPDMGYDAKVCPDGASCPACPDQGVPPDQGVDITPDLGMCTPPCVNGGKCIAKSTLDSGVADVGLMDATYSDAGGGYVCQCPTGYTDATCSTCSKGYYFKWSSALQKVICTKDPICNPSPCLNGGECSSATGKSVCTCKGNWDWTKQCGDCKSGWDKANQCAKCSPQHSQDSTGECRPWSGIGGLANNCPGGKCVEGVTYTATFSHQYATFYVATLTSIPVGGAVTGVILTPTASLTYSKTITSHSFKFTVGKLGSKEQLTVTGYNSVWKEAKSLTIAAWKKPDAGPPDAFIPDAGVD